MASYIPFLCLLLSFFSDFKQFVMMMDSVSQTFGQDTAGIVCLYTVMSEALTWKALWLRAEVVWKCLHSHGYQLM